ncbi:MAG: glutathione-disulfide reductase [Parvularcula sp.]
MAFDVDLFVIGAGSGGVRAARLVAQGGFRVAQAEEFRYGGTCVIRGCVPKKLMVNGSEYGSALKEAEGFGWSVGETRFDWATLRDAVAGTVDRLEGIYERNLGKADVTLHRDRAIVKDQHTVHLIGADRDLTAKKILIAVGGTPLRDERVDPDGVGITSDEVFSLEKRPDRIAIVGGGYIAIEFAHIFAGLGSDVTLIYRGERLLKAFDQDISDRVERNIESAGIRLLKRTNPVRVTADAEDRIVTLDTSETLRVDQLMWAIGRRPKTDGLGLEQAGVKIDRAGAIIVDDDYQTSTDSIFAVGDVTNRVNLTPVAIREGAAFAGTQFLNAPKRMNYHDIPKAVFSQPPVGTVGVSEEQCHAAGHLIDVYESEFRPLKNGIAGLETGMYMKLIVEQGTDKVIGCHLVGPDAPEMIQLVAIAVKAGLTKEQFDETCALHPTAAEELVTMASKRT